MLSAQADAIGALKLRAGVELLDRKMATLRQDISERAASAAKDFKVLCRLVAVATLLKVLLQGPDVPPWDGLRPHSRPQMTVTSAALQAAVCDQQGAQPIEQPIR